MTEVTVLTDEEINSGAYAGTGYVSENGCLCVQNYGTDKDGNEIAVGGTPIANGNIIVQSFRTFDNGIERNSSINCLVSVGTKEQFVLIPSKDLNENKIMNSLPPYFRLSLKRQARAQVVDCIRAQLEQNIPEESIYQHTGWRVIDGKPCFLHAGGAIGMENVSVELSGRLSQYIISDKDSPAKWDWSLQSLDVAPHSITYPLMGMVALSPLNEFLRNKGCEPSFLMFLLGKTGTRKSTLAALFLSYFGRFDNKSLPSSSKDTVNSIEMQGFLLKDVLTTLDDIYPTTNKQDAERMAKLVQEVARRYGDRTGRNRMNSDGSLRQAYIVRGNMLITGEDAPCVGQSGEARFIRLELSEKDVNLPLLTELQRDVTPFSQVMREYIKWLIPQYDDLPAALYDRFLSLRVELGDEGHGRIAESIVFLQLAFELWTLFLSESDAITESKRLEMTAECWDILKRIAIRQNKVIVSEKPSALFLAALSELISTKAVRIHDIVDKDSPFITERIMYKDENYYYLAPGAIYSAISKFYREQERNFPVTQRRLYDHLAAEGLIFCDASKVDKTRQKKINGKNSRYLWLYRDALDSFGKVGEEDE